MVIPAAIRKVVGKALPAREVLFVLRETAAERVPPSVDDPGVGQDEMNKPDVEVIVGHLVDEERRIGLAMHARTGKIAFAERAQLLSVQRRDRIEEWRSGIPLVAPGEFARDLRYFRQLHGALDQRVTRQNLFEQGGSGPRQSHDENGIRRLSTLRLARREKISGVLPLAAPHVARVLIRVVRMQT